ncbi:MAG: glycosyltransferase [Muribaculaceae bacterium]|nr:glycosyltransferase [Muribaculaceae bacterium]
MGNNLPLVSVITPCYNASEYISDAIKSVVNQSFSDWEMIIVDDGSNDNSAEIIKSFVSADNRIKYIRLDIPSGSPSLPRNVGIDNSKGKYIAFLDADDMWLPEKLSQQIKAMEEEGWDLCYSYYEKIDDDGKRDNRIIKTKRVSTYRSLLKSNSIPCLTSIVAKAAIGDTRFKQISQEDFCFWLDILKKGFVAHNICEVTALYRETKASRSANKFDMFKEYWNVIRKHQQIGMIQSCYYMTTYTFYGILKYIK